MNRTEFLLLLLFLLALAIWAIKSKWFDRFLDWVANDKSNSTGIEREVNALKTQNANLKANLAKQQEQNKAESDKLNNIKL